TVAVGREDGVARPRGATFSDGRPPRARSAQDQDFTVYAVEGRGRSHRQVRGAAPSKPGEKCIVRQRFTATPLRAAGSRAGSRGAGYRVARPPGPRPVVGAVKPSAAPTAAAAWPSPRYWRSAAAGPGGSGRGRAGSGAGTAGPPEGPAPGTASS